MSIEVRDVTKRFGDFPALSEVSLTVPGGELVALLGPSGSGKTTLLRIVAGLESCDGGSVFFNGREATQRDVRDRRVGFVFQHYALFRHMTVFENVAFGLTVRPRALRPDKAKIREKVRELLRLVQLESVGDRYPGQLSGGQRQRIALARALAVEPEVLLLDEPFGALDARVRKELRGWLRRLHDEMKITSVFVTHDQEEALEVADRVVVMNEGRIEQVGPPEEVYERPANPFVYNFLGHVNIFHGRVHAGRGTIGNVVVDLPDHAAVSDTQAVAYVRPHDIEVTRERNGSDGTRAVVLHVHTAGPVVRLELDRADGGGIVEAELSRERYQDLGVGRGEHVFIKPRNLRVFLEDYAI
ncbi:MAG: sulfate ABC transporter ATP-binding protein [Deltaproteobacteria bacterium]|nr:MAG: sulfate ABC transporter ATP-binding protein [Deltaproteobacteria bacterium]